MTMLLVRGDCGDFGRTLQLWVREASKCSMLFELSCGSLEEVSVGGSEDDEGLAFEAPERSLKTLSAPSVILNLDSVVLVAGAEELAVANKMPELIRTACT